ncbi:porin family protein [Catalinimonas niigatensis]|uniref:porin family protein n=1 Tax=Catalinimonas niigatensis TaxID=1397264 RepID=UPI002665A1D5|nr:porin family protein [Catalinimonas niigatensis]WPP53040.1 porin family protein [Catalinimonas niigatensis]
MMKKLSLLTTFILVGILAQAQDLRFGVKAGFGIHSFALQNLSDGGTRIGLQIGLLSEIGLENAGLSERFALQPEVLFTTRGGKYNANTTEVKERLSYIDIPVLFKYKPLEAVSLYAGPQLSFLTKGKYKYDRGGDNNTIDNRDAFNKVDYGLVVGTGIGWDNLVIDLRYNLGLGNVLGNRIIQNEILEDVKARNRGVQLSLGYFFVNR